MIGVLEPENPTTSEESDSFTDISFEEMEIDEGNDNISDAESIVPITQSVFVRMYKYLHFLLH